MTNQTVNNMGLIINEMERQIAVCYGFKDLELLTQSYYSLLKRLNHKHKDFHNHQQTENIYMQINKIKSIKEKLELFSIPEMLTKECYADVNYLANITGKLEDILSDLKILLNRLYREYNKKILIVSENKELNIILIKKIIKENNEKLIHGEDSINFNEVMTNKSIYTKTSKNISFLRGNKFDLIYINSILDQESIEFAKSLTKDKENLKFF